MIASIGDLLDKLEPDPWRQAAGFSEELLRVQELMFIGANAPDALLNDWLKTEQPCLFGRYAAKANRLSFCVLTEADLLLPEIEIRDKIQAARMNWIREAFTGKKSGFIILVVSRRLANATPDSNAREIAIRLASLYLLTSVRPDDVFLDEIWLEAPNYQRATWQWFAGVNYFSAQGDKRWWQDHRMPGGMAFSVNSVGHFVKSNTVLENQNELSQSLGLPDDLEKVGNIDTLPRALEFAMRTIALAADGVSGKATELLCLPDSADVDLESAPIGLQGSLSGMDWREYSGYYHTDFTVPSEYFRPDVERPSDVRQRLLDFTYLFDDSIKNPDFITTGAGRRIRLEGSGPDESLTSGISMLKNKAKHRLVSINGNPVLEKIASELRGTVGNQSINP